jgi:L-2-hydroxyglutarate oxidase LhgO
VDEVEVAIAGAGVVGLAIARAFARAGREVLVLEAEAGIGTGTSSRNSEVIHAGIYYPAGSLKARLCVEGKHALYAYAASRHIPHLNCGKLIVATDASQLDALDSIRARAAANGVRDLTFKSASEVSDLEPAIRCNGALWSPSTGIIDSHAFMVSLQGEAEDHGALFAFQTPISAGELSNRGVVLSTGGDHPTKLRARLFINAAGLAAPKIARCIDGFPNEYAPDHHLAKGNYYTLAGRNPFARLIYPVPEQGGLGVHVTIDMGGQCRFGPDVEWVDDLNYDVDPARADKFYAAVRKYWPLLPDGALLPGYSGIRPKRAAKGEADQDFLVQGPQQHGVEGVLNLFGIESPGLTASLALADHVLAMAQDSH